MLNIFRNLIGEDKKEYGTLHYRDKLVNMGEVKLYSSDKKARKFLY